ncbi:Periplasmic protein TonB [Rickettsia akari str. Hartford]|uniref:Periplasmic protein TonB n=1 Tax=Rickettsia akari (strain Hartford) TaxID=293614 RepID=A8GMZ0_RICAH|nr:periplasmic protein TonB, links inner and outer membranes [Rickettsia akari]ABV74765.1 Periplasmic protein TonB [Rickettsia akari str. Hartford]
MKSNQNRDNFTVFLSFSIVLHLLLLYCLLFGMPSLFEKLSEEKTITFEMLSVSDRPNIITQTKQKEAPIENEDATKSEQRKPKEEPQDSPKAEKAKEPDAKTIEEKPKIEEKKPIEEPKHEEAKEALLEKKDEVKEEKPKEEEKKQTYEKKKTEEHKEEVVVNKLEETAKEVKKKEPKTDELDSLLKNLEQSSEGDNVKSNKHKRSKKADNAKEAKGVDTDGLPLSESETSLIKRQIERHWSNVPAGVRGNNKVKVIISITLDKAGNVEHAKVKEKICPNITASVCEALADNAIRAVWQASPIENLDPARFNHWKEINVSFDPSKL